MESFLFESKVERWECPTFQGQPLNWLEPRSDGWERWRREAAGRDSPPTGGWQLLAGFRLLWCWLKGLTHQFLALL
ncbi:hypothetical protein GS597_16505 [Synechococcales cyanobacterium C]|uniref:Uncharacterized protein n=1 Tax=Petrachloros mirabilis ULC683 TaxID=2781853 RepID=A0A8K2A1Q1_9CYAN|nr:hypothetical protein [Petrachloros mirabilis]NCJ08078.1 hypothetical protein [Petrachloros mirabilis ULC683]